MWEIPSVIVTNLNCDFFKYSDASFQICVFLDMAVEGDNILEMLASSYMLENDVAPIFWWLSWHPNRRFVQSVDVGCCKQHEWPRATM